MRAAGVPIQKELLAECNHTLEGGAKGMAKLLALPKPPTAVMCCNDMAALGAMKTMSLRGLAAGRDISLIGFDDLTLCSFTQPSLSTIRFSPSDLATLAFQALLDDIEGDKARQDYEYKTRFVLRDSTGPPRN
jgi:LacI family transcriptional regulator